MKNLMAIAVAAFCAGFGGFAAWSATEIGTAAEFVEKLAADPAGDYALTADIDLTGSGFASIPNFTGKLNGRGHTISGVGTQSLIITNRGELAAFTLDGTTAKGNTYWSSNSHGCICDCCYDAKFTDIVVAGYTLYCNKQSNGVPMALFCAFVYNGTEFIRCATDASAKVVKSQTHCDEAAFVGIITITNKTGVGIRLVDCTNNVNIAASACYGADTSCTGGFASQFKGVGDSKIPEAHFIRCINNGDIIVSHNNRNAGGFIGKCFVGNSSSMASPTLLRFVQCANYGSITGSVGNTTGGFIGKTGNQNHVRFESCLNEGDVGGASVSLAGGYIGLIEGERTSSSTYSDLYINSINNGDVTGVTVGGFFGRITAKYPACHARANIYNCANYGTITGTSNEGALFGKEGTGGVGAIKLDNDWIAAPPVYSNATHLSSMTNIHTNDTDVAGLNAIATATDGYMPWVLGASGKPELACFATTCDESAIPVVFCDWSGTVLKKEFVAKGGSATPPKVPKHDGLPCVGWTAPYKNVQSISICNAIYRVIGLAIIYR